LAASARILFSPLLLPRCPLPLVSESRAFIALNDGLLLHSMLSMPSVLRRHQETVVECTVRRAAGAIREILAGSKTMVGLLKEFSRCESGAVISAELVIVGTVIAAGLATGWAALQQSVVSELNDLSAAISALDQSYSIAGHQLRCGSSQCLAFSAGSRYVDMHVVCDDARPQPMSECCLSPVIIHDTSRPGHWHCDRCGHQHQPPRHDESARGRSQPHPQPPPVPPIPQDPSRKSDQPESRREPVRPRPDAGPERRPNPPPRKPPAPQPERGSDRDRSQPERGDSDRKRGQADQPARAEQGDNDSTPFTPRDDAPAARRKTSETSNGSNAPEESEDITQSDLYMLAQLPVDQPHAYHPPVYQYHGPVVGHPLPHSPYPRYECRGHREPISTSVGCGQRRGYRFHSNSCRGGCDGGAGAIRPGVEYDSGVRGVRVMELPLTAVDPMAYPLSPVAPGPPVPPFPPLEVPPAIPPVHGLPHAPHPADAIVPQIIDHSGYALTPPVFHVPLRINRHEPRFPDYVW